MPEIHKFMIGDYVYPPFSSKADIQILDWLLWYGVWWGQWIGIFLPFSYAPMVSLAVFLTHRIYFISLTIYYFFIALSIEEDSPVYEE